jgi:hypothetical protein
MGLFDFLKPKDQATETATPKAGNLLRAQAITTAIEAQALTAAITRNVPKYLMDVKLGRCRAPACARRPGEPRGNVHDIWEDTRSEALVPLLNHGGSNTLALCRPARQRELFHAFIHDRPHLKFPDVPTGEEVPDTIQAVSQCLTYLRDQCLKAKTSYNVYVGALEGFEKECATANDWWQKQSDGPTADLPLLHDARPPLMIYILWRETTRLAKEIATASIYGPSLEKALVKGVRWAEEKFRDDPKAAKELIGEIKALFERLRASNEPDDLRKI